MDLSRKWLAEFVDSPADDKEYCDAMTLSGSKVEGVTVEGTEIRNVVVGRVLAMERHPDSDHMWTCQVDAGRGAPLQIVTGAQNVNVGDLSPSPCTTPGCPAGCTSPPARSAAWSPTACSAPTRSWA